MMEPIRLQSFPEITRRLGRNTLTHRRDPQKLADFLAATAGWCRAERERLGGMADKRELLAAWRAVATVTSPTYSTLAWLRSGSTKRA